MWDLNQFQLLLYRKVQNYFVICKKVKCLGMYYFFWDWKNYALANAQAKQKGLKNEHSLVRPLEIQLGFSCNGNEESVVVLRY